jgi:hypothetical protein
MASDRYVLEEHMDELFAAEPYFDLEGGSDLISGAFVCECGDEHYLPAASPGGRLTCPTCGQTFLLATRLHLLPF